MLLMVILMAVIADADADYKLIREIVVLMVMVVIIQRLTATIIITMTIPCWNTFLEMVLISFEMSRIHQRERN